MTTHSLRFIKYGLACLLAFNTAHASLKQGIEKILASSPEPIHVGIVVRKADSNQLLYSKNRHHLFTPASTQKLLTATAALLYLGPNFTFKTELVTNGIITDKKLIGDLIVKFSGDPELTSNDLNTLISALKEKGIKEIQGRLILNTHAYDDIYYSPGWIWDDLSYSYTAPLSAAILNKNSFVLRLTPAKKLRSRPQLSSVLPKQLVHFKNSIQTTKQYNNNCPLTVYSDSHNEFFLHGCLNKSWGTQQRNLAVRNPNLYAHFLIRQLLEKNSITLTKPIARLTKIKPHYRTLLALHQSATLEKILTHMLKNSDNLIADSLLKQLGHRYYKAPGNWQNGVKALHEILKPTHINLKENAIQDGSGLSRYNLLTPNQLSQLLQFIYQTPLLHKIVTNALPIAGVDGTLSGRMLNDAKEKRIRAKTGSMTGISALAGYIRTRHLGTISFSLIINGYLGKSHSFTNIEDRLCDYLIDYKE